MAKEEEPRKSEPEVRRYIIPTLDRSDDYFRRGGSRGLKPGERVPLDERGYYRGPSPTYTGYYRGRYYRKGRFQW